MRWEVIDHGRVQMEARNAHQISIREVGGCFILPPFMFSGNPTGEELQVLKRIAAVPELLELAKQLIYAESNDEFDVAECALERLIKGLES